MNELLISDEYKQRLRNVSHEMRNHLSICDMYSQIIKKTLEKSGINNDSIENAIDCIQQSIKIMNVNLLDLKSANSSNRHIVDFEKTVIRASEMAKAYIGEKNIEFNITIKNSANICVDENRFIACLVNIIKNGIEAIELKGKIDIVSGVDSGICTIKISNDGKQIPKEKQHLIFESGYTTKKDGCGLGLALCKKYLQEQNAQLTLVQSTKAITTFAISLKAV